MALFQWLVRSVLPDPAQEAMNALAVSAGALAAIARDLVWLAQAEHGVGISRTRNHTCSSTFHSAFPPASVRYGAELLGSARSISHRDEFCRPPELEEKIVSCLFPR